MTELTLAKKVASSIAIGAMFSLCLYLYLVEVTGNIIPYISLWWGVVILGASITRNKNIFIVGLGLLIPWFAFNFFGFLILNEGKGQQGSLEAVLFIYPIFILISGGMSLYEIWTGEDATDMFDEF